MQCITNQFIFSREHIHFLFLYLVHTTTYFEAWVLEGNLILQFQYCNSILQIKHISLL